jgi:hypothetical protein
MKPDRILIWVGREIPGRNYEEPGLTKQLGSECAHQVLEESWTEDRL